MAIRMIREDTRRGISPDQARADYLANALEEIRSLVSTRFSSANQLLAALRRVTGVFERIPPQA